MIFSVGSMHSSCEFFIILQMSSPLNPLPLLLPSIKNIYCDECMAPQLAVPINHKCYQYGTCPHTICSAMELGDPMNVLDNDSVCPTAMEQQSSKFS